ncbi:MAG: TPM domain-containing protein [Bacteroidetes bacterium]|nr:TPM domain-containing protein [Bacteroidota bacterium]
MANIVKKYFSDSDAQAIAEAIQNVEQNTSGEIRVVIREKRLWRERSMSLESIARKEFLALGMQATRDRTGVLFLVLLRNRQLYIFADEGIYSKLDQSILSAIANEVAEQFSKNEYREGLLHGINKVGELLSRYFPKKYNDSNELPNEVVLR